ncbi:hypothetical protein V502_02640, partial [Pseudogymnoascus sp. VKM F-4520 (FW-2644)]
TSHTGSTGAAMTSAAVGSGVGSGVGHAGLNTGAVYGSTTAGPHDSNIENIVDPRVDSTTGAHTIGSNTAPGYSSTTAGPLDSNFANKVDPRADSTTGAHTTGSNTGAGYGTGGAAYGTAGQTGFPGGLSQSTNAGPHDSNVANKIDPRVDSDLDGRGQRHVAGGTHTTPGSGSAQNTAGPHNSDLLNKVDSNRDGSSTIGSNRTNATYKDCLEATEVPPSVMRESIGEPEALHGDRTHNHSGRHGSVSARDSYEGV